MKMDNLLKSPPEMSAHSHLPTISSHRRLVFHAKKGGVKGRKNQSIEIYLSLIEMRYLPAWKRKTCYIALTSNFCLSVGHYLILIYSLAFPTSIWIASKLGFSSFFRPQKPACWISGPLAYILILDSTVTPCYQILNKSGVFWQGMPQLTESSFALAFSVLAAHCVLAN